MLPPENSNPTDSISGHELEQLIQDGINAVKSGDRSLAKDLLEQAALINSDDARVWVWLSATTDDMQDRRAYLEKALELDPSNTIARRGLSMVTEKLEQSQVKREQPGPIAQKPPPIEETSTKTYVCPNCGANISYSVDESVLVCQFCGFTRKVDEQVITESIDQTPDTMQPAAQTPRWAEGQTRLTCEQCGVTILLPEGKTAESCPYCASDRFVPATSLVEMVDPQEIGLFKIDAIEAGDNIESWLRKGILSPDNLASQHAGMQLHPAYYPFWVFEGTLEIPWFCDVNVGSKRIPQWEAHSGSELESFKDVIIPGLRKFSRTEVSGLEPFDLQDLSAFSPDHLAGEMTLSYDLPLDDASIRARENLQNKFKRNVIQQVEPTRPKRNFSTGAGKWSGLSYKLALLPIYVGNYLHQGKRYRLLVNGQTGKVSGKKPIDTLKASMLIVIAVIILALFSLVMVSLLNRIF